MREMGWGGVTSKCAWVFVFLSLVHLFCVSCEFTFVSISADGYLGIFTFCFVSLELDRKMKGWALIFGWGDSAIGDVNGKRNGNSRAI